MRDPLEGVSPTGMIMTGADLARVPGAFTPVLDAAVAAIADDTVALFVYGSVATGQARRRDSDVDLLTINLQREAAAALSAELTDRFADICRAVEIAAATPGDFVGPTDEAYGGRAFLRHYCVWLRGPDGARSAHEFPADRRAARGLNGDLAIHALRWLAALEVGDDPRNVGRHMARKTLLAVAGLVSIHDQTWTTDRDTAATRWAEIEPDLAAGLTLLREWTRLDISPQAGDVGAALERTVMPIVAQFADRIGLWDT